MTAATPNRPPQDDVDVSVIVAVAPPHYASLPAQLGALVAQETARRFEIVVADNGGQLDPFDLDAEDTTGIVRVVDASTLRGAAYARNQAAAKARGAALLFCDADDVVRPGWIDAHVDALTESLFTVGPTIPMSPGPTATDPSNADRVPHRIRDRPIRHEGIDVGDSANLGVCRSVFIGVGGFPEAYLRSQDVALSLRLRNKGVHPTFVPGAQVQVATGRRAVPAEVRIRFRAGRARMMIARDYGVPSPPWILAPRAAARLGRAIALAVVARRPLRSVAFEAAELCGIMRELARPPLLRPRTAGWQ